MAQLSFRYPTPRQLGIKIPPSLREDRFNAGFRHCLAGGQLDCSEYRRRSFRAGYREGKGYLKALRRQQGIIEFPQKWKFRVRTAWPPYAVCKQSSKRRQ